MNLPQLPEPHFGVGKYLGFAGERNGYTEYQMREYGALCRKQALEEAAKVIESTILTHLPTAKQYEYASLLSAYAKYFRGLMK